MCIMGLWRNSEVKFLRRFVSVSSVYDVTDRESECMGDLSSPSIDETPVAESSPV